MIRKCPICGKPEDPALEPFCSKRCAQVDLGRWLGDGYSIAGEPLEDLPQGDLGQASSGPDDRSD